MTLKTGNIWSIRHNANIILIFLQHNDVGSENCEKSVQILQATRLRKYKVDKDRIFLELDTLIPCPVHFGISKAWLPPYARLSSLYIVREFALWQSQIIYEAFQLNNFWERLQNTPAQPLHVSVCFEERGI